MGHVHETRSDDDGRRSGRVWLSVLGGEGMTSERMKEINREWRKLCMPIYIKAFTVVMIFCAIIFIVAIIAAIITGELQLW